MITDLAVMAIDKSNGRLRIDRLMPGVTVEQVRSNTGFDLPVAAEAATVDPPTEAEVRLLREEVDPEGEYLKSAE